MKNLTKISNKCASDEKTALGQFSWAGEGEGEGKICFQCRHWAWNRRGRPKRPSSRAGCKKFFEFYNGPWEYAPPNKRAKTFEGYQEACRYIDFDPSITWKDTQKEEY